jgi:hypothetical protein
MRHLVATAIAGGPADAVAEMLVRSLRRDLAGQPPALLLVFASLDQPLDEVLPPLRAAFPGATLLGCSTAGEFTEKGHHKRATAALAVAGNLQVFAGLGRALGKDPAAAAHQATASIPGQVEGYSHRTALVLLDPLAGNGEEATLHVAALLGAEVPLAGGAAGDYLHMDTTQVAVDDEVAADALAVAVLFSQQPLGIGVCHGHRPLSEPLQVTRAVGNVVHQIEGRPAWRVWKEHTRAHSLARGVDPEELTGDDIRAYLLRYEAGLAAGEGYKIRAPLALEEDGSMRFACGIPQGSILRITEGDPPGQVESAREAARRARRQLHSGEIAGAVVFDCICRNLILGDDFDEAVRGISEALEGAPLAGFETYGEIALDVGELSGFHNTTTVVLAFPR